MIDATVADTVDEVIQLIYGIMCSHNQEVLRKLDDIEIISDEEEDIYPILDPVMMSAQWSLVYNHYRREMVHSLLRSILLLVEALLHRRLLVLR